jgi:hypothetical protein
MLWFPVFTAQGTRLVCVINSFYNSLHYTSFCLLLKMQRFGEWIMSASSDGTYSVELSRYS